MVLAVTDYGGTIFVCAILATGPKEPGVGDMEKSRVTRDDFLEDSQGKTFSDVVNDSDQPFDSILEFFADSGRQRRMEESELHHERAPLAGVIRELESLPDINEFLGGAHAQRNTRFRQAIGVLVRMIMERRGWQKTGRKGSLGVRAAGASRTPAHNSGGLAFWFVRAERYLPTDGTPYKSVRQRCEEFESVATVRKQKQNRNGTSMKR